MDENYKKIKSEILKRHTFKYRVKKIVTKNKWTLILIILLVLLLATFALAAFLNSRGTFTIGLRRQDAIDYGLVLSETPDFPRPRYQILAKAMTDMWNITRSSIPKDVSKIDGQHNGENYMAITFYLKNNGIKNLKYRANIDLNEVYRNVDEALRIEIYVNDVPTIYAKMSNKGENIPEPNTTPFLGKVRMIALDTKPIDIGQVDKFTIVSWVEGEDPDCTNDLLGGFVLMMMNFEAEENTGK